MPFTILPCTDADMPPAFALVTETFQHEQPYHDALWPEHWKPDGQKAGVARFRASCRSEPNLHFVKAVDDASGQLAGLVRYYVLPHGEELDEGELEGDYWPTEEEREYACHLYREYLSLRRRTVREVGTPFVCLDMLTVHPHFQSRGAGSSLVKWGTDMADGMGAEMSVESSFLGLNVYKKYGYGVVEEITLPVPEKWEDRPKVHFWFMRRGKKAEAEAST